jgi:hypothetical protein
VIHSWAISFFDHICTTRVGNVKVDNILTSDHFGVSANKTRRANLPCTNITHNLKHMGLLDLFSAKPSKDKFASMVANALRNAGIQGEPHYNSEKFAIVVNLTDGTVFTANLHNIYIDFGQASKDQREAELKKYATGIVAMQMALPADYQVAKRNLLPLVRSAIDEIDKLLHAEAVESKESILVSKTLIPDIVVQVGFDSEYSIRRIEPGQLKDWGVTFEQALADAIDNLRDRTTDEWGKIGSGAFIGQWADHYDTSRVLLLDCLYRLPLVGEPVVLLPTRETLLVTGANDIEGQAALVATAEEALQQQPRRISMSMLRYDGKAWQLFMPEGAAGERLRALQQESLAQDYEHQKAVMEELHKKTGDDVYVATYSRFRKKNSEKITSYATWTNGVDTLLPVTDIIIFVNPGATQDAPVETAGIPWDMAITSVAALMERTDHMPPRWRVRAFPDADLFDEFKAKSVLE